MNSKKAQSEIITTVLIILLVLAAIIIVWQVVSSTIGKARSGIDDNNLCLGTQISLDKATAGNGTCTYTVGAAPCNVAGANVYNKILDGSNCPASHPTTTGCGALIGGPAPTPTVPGNVYVTRNAASGNDANVTIRVFVGGVQNPATSSPLAIYGNTKIPITGLNISQQVKIAAILSQDGFLCPATPDVTVITP